MASLPKELNVFSHDTDNAVFTSKGDIWIYPGEPLVREATGARIVAAFDHTVRSAAGKKSKQKIDAMQRALGAATKPSDQLTQKIYETRSKILAIDSELNGNKAKADIGEKNVPSATSAENVAKRGLSSSTYGPTDMHRSALNIGKTRLKAVKNKLSEVINSDFPALEADLKAAGAPWIETQGLINE